MKLYSVLLPVVKAIVRPIWDPKIFGLENLPPTGGAILAANHQSAAETYMIPALIPRQVHWLAKDNLFRGKGSFGKIFAWILRSVNVIEVDRSGSGKADAALQTGIKILNSGKLLGVFPEGTRSPDGRLYKAKTGVARLALATGVPVIPAAVQGAFEAQVAGSIFPKKSAAITIKLGAPINLRQELQKLRANESQEASEIKLEQVEHKLSSTQLLDTVKHEELVELSWLIMQQIQKLSGQSYVDEYAHEVKKRLKEQNSDS